MDNLSLPKQRTFQLIFLYTRMLLIFIASFFLLSSVRLFVVDGVSSWSAHLLSISLKMFLFSLFLLTCYQPAIKQSELSVSEFFSCKDLFSRVEKWVRHPGFKLWMSLLLVVILGGVGFLSGLMIYSPDSWAYFELSKSVFGGDFYKFNTFRSYYSIGYSTSFPLGYPFILALAHVLFGTKPLVAVFVNVAVVPLTFLIILRLSGQLHLSSVAGIVLVFSLVLWPEYLDEVFSGGSIPVALFLFLSGCSLFFSKKYFYAGLLLGFSALVRFDYLIYSIVLQGGFFLLDKSSWRNKSWLALFGFMMGLLPWIVYSHSHFDRFWVSDNSWVALSALPAYVVDFPAAAAISAIDAPFIWIKRILGNIFPLMRAVGISVIDFPLIALLFLIFIVWCRRLPFITLVKIWMAFLLICAAFIPYLLTGYFDHRYFALIFLVSCFMFVYSFERLQPYGDQFIFYKIALITSLVLNILIGGSYLMTQVILGLQASHKEALAEKTISLLAKCHSKNPNVKFIFNGNLGYLTSRYGALTGFPTAMIPSNFDKMTGQEKSVYFDYIKPYIMIENLENFELCPSMN